MKALGLGLITAALAIGCSGGLTSPTTSYEPAAAAASQDVKPPTHIAGTQAATIYFNARHLELVGHEHLVGLPVHLDGFATSGTPTTEAWDTWNKVTGKQGTVSADFPKTATSIHVTTPLWHDTDADRDDEWWCATDIWVPLPYVPRENWIDIAPCPAP